jgi:hypothetical protein
MPQLGKGVAVQPGPAVHYQKDGAKSKHPDSQFVVWFVGHLSCLHPDYCFLSIFAYIFVSLWLFN